MFVQAVRQPKTPGESLKFLPPAELPPDLHWAKANPIVAQAFARFSTVINQAAEQSKPLQVQKHVLSLISKWQGEPAGPSKRWINEETKDFDEPAKTVAQLTLLASVAPWQIDESIILKFKQYVPEDHSLVSTLAWGNLAARRIGTWLQITNT